MIYTPQARESKATTPDPESGGPFAKFPLPLLLHPPHDLSRYDMDALGWLLCLAYEEWRERKHQRRLKAGKKAGNKAHAARLARRKHVVEYEDGWIDREELDDMYEEWLGYGRKEGEPEPWHPEHNPKPLTERQAMRKAYKKAKAKEGTIPQNIVLRFPSLYALTKVISRDAKQRKTRESVRASLERLKRSGLIAHLTTEASVEVQLSDELLAMTGRNFRKRRLPLLLTSEAAQRLDALLAVYGAPRWDRSEGKKLPSLLSEGVSLDTKVLAERVGLVCDRGHSFRTNIRRVVAQVNRYRAATKGRGPQIDCEVVGGKAVFKLKKRAQSRKQLAETALVA
jgi:hypothetical protein